MSSLTLSSSLWGVIRSCLRPFKGQVALYLLLSMVVGWWGPVNSLLMKHLIDSLASGASGTPNPSALLNAVMAAAGLVVNILVLDTMVWRFLGELRQRYVPVLLNRLDQSLLHYVLGHSHHFFNNHMSGSLAKNMFHLLNGIEKILTTSVCHIVRALSVLVASCVCAWQVSPWICLIMSVWFALFFGNNMRMSKRLMHLSQEQAACESLLGGQITDSLSQSTAVRFFAQRHGELQRRTPALNAYVKAYRRKETYSLRLNMMQGGMIALMISLSLGVLVWLFRQHRVSVGDFALIVGLIMEMGHILWHTMAEVQEFNKERGRCHQSLQLLLQPHDIINKPEARALESVQGNITFRHVTFAYPRAAAAQDHTDHTEEPKPLFQDLSITIQAGQKVGLVGYSGGGKTSFVNLILRLYDVNQGAVLIDGHDVRDVTQDSLRANIAMIPQDPALFHRTLMDNIRYGRPSATDREVIQAATLAHAHDFIMQLPQGYDSLVGDRGVKLSGGQRQRIAIARAILKNAPILILDEATSQLDSITETRIQESLLTLMNRPHVPCSSHEKTQADPSDHASVEDNANHKPHQTHGRHRAPSPQDNSGHENSSQEHSPQDNSPQEHSGHDAQVAVPVTTELKDTRAPQGKTTIVIAHRLSTLLHMDRILVFQQGAVVQDGTHSDLLAQEGLYQTLWNAQVGGFLHDHPVPAPATDSPHTIPQTLS